MFFSSTQSQLSVERRLGTLGMKVRVLIELRVNVASLKEKIWHHSFGENLQTPKETNDLSSPVLSAHLEIWCSGWDTLPVHLYPCHSGWLWLTQWLHREYSVLERRGSPDFRTAKSAQRTVTSIKRSKRTRFFLMLVGTKQHVVKFVTDKLLLLWF